jgi:transposase
MQPNTPRRVHSLELKTAVLAECRQPGASVSAVALSHGLNANLVRKWLVGRGLKRAMPVKGGSQVPAGHAMCVPIAASAASPMRFVPVELAVADAGVAVPGPAPQAWADIHIELRRGSAQLTVRWPSSQAEGCAAWLSELAGAVLK